MFGDAVRNVRQIFRDLVHGKRLHFRAFLRVDDGKICHVVVVLHIFLQYLVVFQMHEAEHEMRITRGFAFDADRHARVLRLDVQQDKGTLAEIRPELHDRIEHTVRRIRNRFGIQAVDRHAAE